MVAKNRNGNSKAAAKQTAAEVYGDLPEGFDMSGYEDMTRPEIDGWYSPEAHSGTVAGTIVGRIEIPDEERDGEMRDVVLLELAVPVSVKDSKTEEISVLEPGKILGVGIRHDLRILLSYVEHKGKCIFKPTGKTNLKGGRKKWNFKVDCKGTKSAPPAPTPAQPGTHGSIPF